MGVWGVAIVLDSMFIPAGAIVAMSMNLIAFHYGKYSQYEAIEEAKFKKTLMKIKLEAEGDSET